MLTRLRLLAAALLALVLVAACGQKGPLYLPGNPTQVKTDVPPQNQTEPPQEEDDDEPEDETDDD